MRNDNIHISVNSVDPISLSIDKTNTSRIDITTPVVVGGQDYNYLKNLPSLNGVTLKGSLTYLDLFLTKESVNTKAYWDSHLSYVPELGELVIYIDKETIDGIVYQGIKIGDGNAYLVDLPFVGDDLYNRLTKSIADHVNNTSIHVTEEEKIFWNNKLNCVVEDGNLVFNRL